MSGIFSLFLAIYAIIAAKYKIGCGYNGCTYTPTYYSKAVLVEDDKHIDSNNSKGFWIILLIVISGFGIYYLKQQKTQNLLAVPKKNKNQPKKNAVTKKVESQKQKKEMSREDILKQQQINAFKKIK
jgi:uncharacterized protein HemX